MRRKKRFNGVLWMCSTVNSLRYWVFLKIKRVSKEAPPPWKLKLVYSRSSRPECSVKEMFLETLQNSQENTCARDSFFNKVVDLQHATLLKKRLWHRCFFCEFCEISKNTFFNRIHLVAASSILRETWKTSVQPMSNRNFSHFKRN